ncbi:uncharacterized protein LOC116194649 [Punica granatum]|uniref:DUF7148 domain-containing protein n=2 Tax=Punica granatum TaxID=22663 RepID=A0A218X293_PUNGR|nr:uncharacterized protein LOC116194649 [Punica granatum]OWM79073.1 hypothetical protein CDL15_Pgr003244 [Punica granatum]PKI49356.1 hypothetical protein CRG98_030284 [Punica granatum]
MASALRQLLSLRRSGAQAEAHQFPLLQPKRLSRSSLTVAVDRDACVRRFSKLSYGRRNWYSMIAEASPESDGIVPSSEDDDGVSLGTMKLPPDTDLPRFETLLFQWANSLCQGANLPLPMPLKVDKIPGGARLGFITIGDGETEVLVYIDCLVFPPTEGSVPIFRAIRNGPLKDQPPPGEPRIMRSLLGALKKSVEIARL